MHGIETQLFILLGGFAAMVVTFLVVTGIGVWKYGWKKGLISGILAAVLISGIAYSWAMLA